MEIYRNNDVVVEIQQIEPMESKVNFNGENLIWISRSEQEQFITELQGLFDKYRI